MQHETIRIDKWLWSVRVFKTRSQATQACRAGKVLIDDLPVKPSREMHEHMIVTVKWGPIIRTLKVIGLLKNRVGAKLVQDYMHDLTPDDEYKKLENISYNDGMRPHGKGRPTKKERRDLDNWFK